jgi:hypothetical protein
MAERIKIHSDIEEANQTRTAKWLKDTRTTEEIMNILTDIATMDDWAINLFIRALKIYQNGPEAARNILDESKKTHRTKEELEEAMLRAEALAR